MQLLHWNLWSGVAVSVHLKPVIVAQRVKLAPFSGITFK